MPQGSPIPLLLFLLYMAEPMCSRIPGIRSSFADDVKVLGIGESVAESTAVAQREVDDIL